jgi:transketolase
MQDNHVVNVFKGLVIDGVHKANSGHPGGPMSSMDLAYILFSEYLKFDPDDARWMGRDRFILSAGHMSMLQYAMLHGVGWLSMDDLKNFRQFHSKTPGHPENTMTPGVECTTGPLGQGAAMSVGFALATQQLAASVDKELFNYKTWAIVSDGDLQEGVAMGSASLAGHLKLNNLVWIYDKNYIQLSGPTDKCVSDDDEHVYRGFGWDVIKIDGHNHDEIRAAYKKAAESREKPTIIIAKTVIGKGCATLENSSKTHGSPLPADERAKTKEKLGLPADKDFWLPGEVLEHFRRNFSKRRDEAKSWKAALDQKMKDSAFAKTWQARFGKTSDCSHLSEIKWDKTKEIATRNAFGDIIKQWAAELPALFGGSADLEPSNMTGAFAKAVGDFDDKNRAGRNLNFGVREFPMSALCNGMALHGGFVPFDATFLSFADYSRGALRLGAIQKCRVIHEFTHDSFYLGEDGPTHQPIEQVMALRLIPDFFVMRPADPVETEVLMQKAIELDLPSALCLTRQKVPYLKLDRAEVKNATKGAYVVKDTAGADLLLIATGSEVSLALAAADTLIAQGRKVRVVSMPCWELFEAQSKDYRNKVLPPQITQRVSIEAGTTIGWAKYTGMNGLNIGIDHYGESAPAEVLAEEYGFTPEKVLKKILGHSFH